MGVRDPFPIDCYQLTSSPAVHRYESATEGDSFILAFRDPWDALRFALAAQDALLAAPWPQQLLDSDVTPTLAVSYSHMQYKRYAPWISCTRLLAAMGKRGGGGGGGGQRAGPQPGGPAPAPLPGLGPSMEDAGEASTACHYKRTGTGILSSPAVSDRDSPPEQQQQLLPPRPQMAEPQHQRSAFQSMHLSTASLASLWNPVETQLQVCAGQGPINRCGSNPLSAAGGSLVCTVPSGAIAGDGRALPSGGSTPLPVSPVGCGSDGAILSPHHWTSPNMILTRPTPRHSGFSQPNPPQHRCSLGADDPPPSPTPLSPFHPPPLPPARQRSSPTSLLLSTAMFDRTSNNASLTHAQGKQLPSHQPSHKSLFNRSSSRVLPEAMSTGSSRLPAVLAASPSEEVGSQLPSQEDCTSPRMPRARQHVQAAPSGRSLLLNSSGISRAQLHVGGEVDEAEATLPLLQVLRRVFPVAAAAPPGDEAEGVATGRGRRVIFRCGLHGLHELASPQWPHAVTQGCMACAWGVSACSAGACICRGHRLRAVV